MNITLTITASPELTEILQGLISVIGTKEKTKKAPVDKTPKEEAPVVETPTPPSVSVASEKEITVETVRAKVQQKAQAGKREAVKSLLTKFGADKVTSLDKAKYTQFVEELETV